MSDSIKLWNIPELECIISLNSFRGAVNSIVETENTFIVGFDKGKIISFEFND